MTVEVFATLFMPLFLYVSQNDKGEMLALMLVQGKTAPSTPSVKEVENKRERIFSFFVA